MLTLTAYSIIKSETNTGVMVPFAYQEYFLIISNQFN